MDDTTLCRSQSRYGKCGRTHNHNTPHAVPIGDGIWYGYERGGKPIGYGYFTGDTFIPAEPVGATGSQAADRG
ncbi:hypothetical protein [Micromonospora sediminicola]|uniref:hypothetical protein n=1 Tax=Micromonospora sediminicola TaxID=946078 RepID=UPI0037B2F742